MATACAGSGATARTPSSAPRASATATAAPATAAPTPAPAPPQHRVALFGDGLVDGNGLPDAQSLPYLLAAARPDLLLLDLGLTYESSDKVLARDRDATEQHLDAAVIWVGTYDPAAGNSAQQYAQNMAQLLDDFKGTHVVLLPPVTLPGGRSAAPYAAALAQVAAQRGVTVTDISPAMRSADWQGDGRDLGPNADAALAPLLEQLLPAPSQPAVAAPPPGKRVVLIGDSLSYGSELDPPQDLPNQIRALSPDLDVVDTAVGGQESADALSRLRQFRLLHADVAVIWIGTQDADDGVPVARFEDNVRRLAAGLAPARIVLATPIADYSVSATGFMPYAAATRDLARQLGATLVDMGDPAESQYQSDGVHLDAAAEAQAAAEEARAI